MKGISLVLIGFYQRWISPIKGFNCAHHVLHGEATCSNAIKSLIAQHGLIRAWPLIKHRFAACGNAFKQLQGGSTPHHRSDLPCDLSCDMGFADCGSVGPSPDTAGICFLPCAVTSLSRRAERSIVAFAIVLALILSYVYYGRDISSVYLVDLGQRQQTAFSRLLQREQAMVRVLVEINGRETRSEIVEIGEIGVEHQLLLDEPLSSFAVDRLEVHDARLRLGDDSIVVGQVLETFTSSGKQAQGKRYQYRLKRRWHLN